MVLNSTFESLTFNPFLINNTLNIANHYHDINFFLDNLSSFNPDYISPQNFEKNFEDLSENSFFYISLLEPLKQKIQIFKEFSKLLRFEFRISCFSEA